ncbi:DUF4269 domain-containing protein [Zunongwangia sp. M21534]|uniref:DUF4269 domain-containing protein n=1 Tax=Zunongwangia pacifica TaxID=2911062 RepID=A0A9X2CJA5_9FLAO|nr:DUF4269 domain-containing protein [Zunongwangia pacifica]MCL6217606.1 DUF4269 domain-containing protein [Zunongwangia pacifica]
MDFKNLDYLKHGSTIQQLAYHELSVLKIMWVLDEFHPVLTGTIPLDIAISSSDLDISCTVKNHDEFKQKLFKNYAEQSDFSFKTTSRFGETASICCFEGEHFKIEIFGQHLEVTQQNAYRHMIIDHKILKENDNNFSREIIKLKREGLKNRACFRKIASIGR